jgi:hypothetical protein
MARTALPFVERRYRPDTRRLSDLMAMRRQVEIDRELANADANRQMVGQISNTLTGTLGSLMEWKAGEPARKAAEAEQARIASERERKTNAERAIDEGLRHGYDKTELGEQMIQLGLGREGDALRKEGQAERKGLVSEALQSINTRLDVFGRAEEATAQLARNPSLYPELRPHLQSYAQAIDPSGELAQQIPLQLTSPEQATEIHETVTSTARTLRAQQAALKKIEDGMASRLKGIEYRNKVTEGIIEALILAPGPEEAKAALDNFAEAGIEAEILDPLRGLTPKQLNERLLTPEQRAKRDDPEDVDFTDYLVKKFGVNYTADQMLQARREFEAAGRAPKDTSAADDTRALARQTAADTWKMNELQQAERDFERAAKPYTEATLAGGTPNPQPIPASVVEAHETRKRDIQYAYLSRLGLPPSATPPAPPDPRRAAAIVGEMGAATPASTAPRRMGDVISGRPTPQPMPAGPPAPPVTLPARQADAAPAAPLGRAPAAAAPIAPPSPTLPPSVVREFGKAEMKPGRYTLANGWIITKHPDGRLERIK